MQHGYHVGRAAEDSQRGDAAVNAAPNQENGLCKPRMELQPVHVEPQQSECYCNSQDNSTAWVTFESCYIDQSQAHSEDIL